MSIKKLFAAALICVASAAIAFGQTAKYPFGTNKTYPNGFKPATVDTAKARSWYNAWKGEALKNCTGKGIMVTADDQNQVKVEGVGWAMIATAYMGDKENFDGIYQFYNASSKLTPRSGGMMSWLVDCNGIYQNSANNEGTAPDGDLDVAFGLVVASWQWGGAYLDSARAAIGRVRQIVNFCGDLAVIAGGYNGGVWGGGCNYTDMSYYSPAFFRVFADVTGDTVWNKLANDTYTHLERNANAATGLVSDWHSVQDGAPFLREGGAQDKDTYYSYDACRTPWRIALDYLWNGDERAKTWATKITTWAHGQGVSSLKDGYNLDGTPSQQGNAGIAFLGAWAVGAMTHSQTITDAFGTAVSNASTNHWYQRHTGNMYLLALTGNMWKEDMLVTNGVKLAVAIEGKGSVKRSPDKYLYSSGDKVTLTARPDRGYVFDGWSGTGTSNSKDTVIEVTLSASTNITARFVLSADGTNLVVNGDFSDGMNGWALNKWGNSQASESVGPNGITITINTLPTDNKITDLQLVQATLPLLKGNTYRVSFDASATAARTMLVMAQLGETPWTSYFEKTVELTTNKESYIIEFEMTENNNEIARLGFNIGNENPSVTIGNISVILLQGNVSIADKNIPQANVKKSSLKVTAKKSAISVKFKAKNSGTTDLRLYGLKGNLVAKTNLQTVSGKSYTHTFNASNIPNGFYVVSVHSNGVVEQSRVIIPK